MTSLPQGHKINSSKKINLDFFLWFVFLGIEIKNPFRLRYLSLKSGFNSDSQVHNVDIVIAMP